MVVFIATFFLAFLITILVTPLVKVLALKIGAVDKPNQRKIHEHIIPRLGGLSIYLGFIFAIFAGISIANNIGMRLDIKSIYGILLSSGVILILGIADDVYCLSPRVKFFWQVMAALLVFFMGVGISFISTPFNKIFPLAIYFSLPLTVLWLVGITNSINLIDGLDGLAAGVTAISALTFFFVSLSTHQYGAGIVMLALAGASLGFLKYNFFPAKIFLGDSGSLVLGFILAAASISGVFKTTLVVALIIPLLILGVPIFDTLFAIGRRMKNHAPIFQADDKHIHHMLLRAGFSQREAVMSIYIVCFLLCFSALVMVLNR